MDLRSASLLAGVTLLVAIAGPAGPTPAGAGAAAPGATLTPGSLDLGTLYLGHPRRHPVSVRNRGVRPVPIGAVDVEGPLRVDRAALPEVLAPGASGWFVVECAPAAPGGVAARATLRGPDGAALASLPVVGVAVRAEGPSVVAHGARGDGATDDRAAFQAAADAAARARKPLLVPRPPGGGPYRLSGVVRVSGSVLGEPGARPWIRMAGARGEDAPGDASPHTILHVRGARGATLAGLRLDGGRDLAPGTNVYGLGEHSHGIALEAVRDVWLEDLVIEAVQGDAVLVGGQPGAPPCEDVRIVASALLRPMRCAVFAGDARRLRVWLNRIEKVVEYQSAIDLEPNQPPQAVWDAEVAYNDFGETLRHDHGVITSTLATRIARPGGRVAVHDNWGAPGRYRFHLDLAAPGSTWEGNAIQRTLGPPPAAPQASADRPRR